MPGGRQRTIGAAQDDALQFAAIERKAKHARQARAGRKEFLDIEHESKKRQLAAISGK